MTFQARNTLASVAMCLSLLVASGAAAQETFLECSDPDVSDDDFEAIACKSQTNDQIWHDATGHNFCRQEATVGCNLAEQCLGRCGPGCGGAFGAGTYRLDCTEHDQCCRTHGNCFSPLAASCGDEWIDAADDFIFGPRDCLTCSPNVPTSSWNPLLGVGGMLALVAVLLLVKHGRQGAERVA